MPFTFKNHVEFSGVGDITSASIDTTGADFIAFCVVRYMGGSGFSLQDSYVNTWLTSPPMLQDNSIIPSAQIHYAAASGKTGTGHTFTINGSFQYAVGSVMAFSGGKQSGAYDQQSGQGGSPFTSSASPGSVTPTENNELIVSVLGWDTANAMTGVTGADAFYQVPGVGGVNYGGGGAYAIQLALGAINMTWNFPTITLNGNVASASFKSAAGGALIDTAAWIIIAHA